MVKILVNMNPLGFMLSEEGLELYKQLKIMYIGFGRSDIVKASSYHRLLRGDKISRDDPVLHQVVDILVTRANIYQSESQIVTLVPDIYTWRIKHDIEGECVQVTGIKSEHIALLKEFAN